MNVLYILYFVFYVYENCITCMVYTYVLTYISKIQKGILLRKPVLCIYPNIKLVSEQNFLLLHINQSIFTILYEYFLGNTRRKQRSLIQIIKIYMLYYTYGDQQNKSLHRSIFSAPITSNLFNLKFVCFSLQAKKNITQLSFTHRKVCNN